MKKKTKVIASALTTIALCLSLAIGGTFALFTSESKVAVNIVTGTVDVTATAENLTLYSPAVINSNGTVSEGTANAANNETKTFVNGGTATLEGGEITLQRMTAGDKATFYIVIHNGSNVKVKYRTVIKVTEDTGLFSGLTITVGGVAYNGATTYSQWANAGSADITVPVEIELPANAGNAYQNKSCKISYSVEAVQGNVATEDPETDVVYIYNANDLKLFAASVNNGTSYSGKTVKLMDNIDLAGSEWTPVGQTGGYSARTYFQGTFDGNNKTISNLTIRESSWEAGSNDGKNFATGFFGFIDAAGATIKNVTFNNATVEGHHWVGVVAGYMTGTVSGVKVTNSTVTSTYKTGEADGDKAGGIVGYLNSNSSVTDCTVSDSTITAVRDCGSVVGHSSGSVTGNTAENCTVYYTTDTVEQIGGEIAGKRANGVSGNTANNVTVAKLISTAEQLSAALNATYNVDTTIVLANDINLGGAEWGAHALNATNNAALIIDGNGKTITGLKSTAYANLGGFNSNGLITTIGAGFSIVTFKNLTVSGAELTNNGGESAATGVFVGDTNTVNVTFDNCKVIGATINCFKYAGGFIGYTQDVNTDKKTVTFNNCAVIDSKINTTDSSAGGLVGHNCTALVISGCKIKGNTKIACAEDRTGDVAKAGYLIGTANQGSATISNITVDDTVDLDTKGGTTYDTTKYIGRNYATVTGVTANS